MELRRHIWGVAIVTGLLAAFAWLVLRPHERFYQGRPLSWWLRGLPQNGWYSISDASPRFDLGNRELARELVPVVVELAGTRRTIVRMVVGEMAQDHDFSFLHLPPQGGKHELAIWVCRKLGPEARPTVPGLSSLLTDRDPWVRMTAARCLGAIGPAADEAVPSLIASWSRVIKNNVWPEDNVRACIAEALGEMGAAARPALPYLEAETNELCQLMAIKIKGESFEPFLARLTNISDLAGWNRTVNVVGRLGTNAAPAVPLLVPFLSQSNRPIPRYGSTIHEQTLSALAQIHSHPEICVPAILPLLASSNLNVRVKSVSALGALGPAAKAAVPQLLKCLQEHQSWLQNEVTNALREIDPATASRMGLRSRNEMIRGPEK